LFFNIETFQTDIKLLKITFPVWVDKQSPFYYKHNHRYLIYLCPGPYVHSSESPEQWNLIGSSCKKEFRAKYEEGYQENIEIRILNNIFLEKESIYGIHIVSSICPLLLTLQSRFVDANEKELKIGLHSYCTPCKTPFSSPKNINEILHCSFAGQIEYCLVATE
jgi:hypothetical protein